MTLFLVAFILVCVLSLVSYVQVLYLESLRLRTREYESLDHFKATLQGELRFDNEEGAFVFSLIKHTLLVVTGSVIVALYLLERDVWWSAIEGGAIAWLLMVVASYVIPQLLFRRSSGHWVTPLAPLLRLLALLFRPLTALMGFLESLYELSEPAKTGEEEPNPAEEIEALITAGEEEGIIEKEDSRLIQQVVAFGDKTVREVMTPRPAMIAIPVDRTLDDLRALVRNEQFSRVPVYEDTIDHIIGFIHVRDLWELDESKRDKVTIRSLMRPIVGVPESKPAADLLREMQARGAHMAYVVDEYGNVAGLVTFEDLVEEVFGEIRDEHEPAHDIQREPGGAIVVSGSFDLDHLHELFGYRPGPDIESTTVGGLVTEWLGSVPKPGAAVERDGLCIKVLAADDLRVKRVRICRADDDDDSDD